MASSILAGFVKGAANKYVDYVDKRDAEEQDKRKSIFLEQLRRDTQMELASFQEELQAKRPDDKMSTADYASGKFTQRDRNGNVISARDLTEAERTAHDQETKKGQLELDLGGEKIKSEQFDRNYKSGMLANDTRKTTAEINASNAHAVNERAQARSYSLDGSGKGGVDSTDIGLVLMDEYKDQVADVQKDGIPAELIAKTANAAAANAKARGQGMGAARSYFTESLGRLRTGLVPSDTPGQRPTYDYRKIDTKVRKPLDR